MDSITHLCLGGLLGEAFLGRRAGTRALLCGAILGSLPDIDMAVYPFLDPIGQLELHRGATHSLFFEALAAPIFGWLLSCWKPATGRLKETEPTSAIRWTLLALLAFWTHTLLDCFTGYGTQALLPFRDLRIGWNILFMLDPLLTGPMFLLFLTIPWLKRKRPGRRKLAATGLLFVVLYLTAATSFQAKAESVFREELTAQGHGDVPLLVKPTAFNTLLWVGIARIGDDYLVSDYSLFDPPQQHPFSAEKTIRLQGHPEYLDLVREQREVERLLWFAGDFYRVSKEDESGTLCLEALSFSYPLGPNSGVPEMGSVFRFVLEPGPDGIKVHSRRSLRGLHLNYIQKLVERIWGGKGVFGVSFSM